MNHEETIKEFDEYIKPMVENEVMYRYDSSLIDRVWTTLLYNVN